MAPEGYKQYFDKSVPIKQEHKPGDYVFAVRPVGHFSKAYELVSEMETKH